MSWVILISICDFWGIKADWGIFLIWIPAIFGTKTQNIKNSLSLCWGSLTETWCWTKHATEPQLERSCLVVWVLKHTRRIVPSVVALMAEATRARGTYWAPDHTPTQAGSWDAGNRKWSIQGNPTCWFQTRLFVSLQSLKGISRRICLISDPDSPCLYDPKLFNAISICREQLLVDIVTTVSLISE